MFYDGPLCDEEIVIHVFPVKIRAKLPLGYFVVPRDEEIIRPGDMCWLSHDQLWGTGSMKVGERVNQYYCIIRKSLTFKNQVTIE